MYCYIDATRDSIVAPFATAEEARQHALDNGAGTVRPKALELVATARATRRRAPEVGSFAHFVALGQ